jgi:hypothetical protein
VTTRHEAFVTSLISRTIVSVSIACATAVAAQVAHAQQLDVTGSVRARMESWSWCEAEANSDYTYVGVLGRAALSKQARRYGWQAELAAPVLLGLPVNPMGPTPQGQLGLGAAYWVANDSADHAASLFLKQAFLRVGVPDTARGQGVRIGRFEFVDGGENTPANPTLAALKRDRIAHRLIGNFSWSHVQRSYDGVQYTWNGAGSHPSRSGRAAGIDAARRAGIQHATTTTSVSTTTMPKRVTGSAGCTP